MKLIEAKDYKEMSMLASRIISEQVRSKKDSVLGLATGGTVLGTYQQLILDHQDNGTDYSEVRTFNLDEYAGLHKDDENSYHTYMKKHFFDSVNVSAANTNLPDGEASDLEKECGDYDRLISESGGIDLQLLGIGQNGHIGFNEPGSSFDSNTHLVKLAQSTREANARYFDRIEDVPKHAVTMGIASIMRSKKILLLASGVQKAAILNDLFHADVSEDIPATVLRNHPNAVIIADREALSKLQPDERKMFAR